MTQAETAETIVPVLPRLLAAETTESQPRADVYWRAGALEPTELPEDLLAVLNYGIPHSSPDKGRPHATFALMPLEAKKAVEYFAATGAISHGQNQSISWAGTDELLLGNIELQETASLDAVALEAYRELLEMTRARGYPHLLRIWNYFPGINRVTNGLERYRQFCIGRHQAFSEQHVDFRSLLPSATAVGTAEGPLQILFLASTQPGLHIENPRQLSAYHYPTQYGPRSPAFARATLHKTQATECLYISGTSSIVGHSSQHPGNPYLQALETLRNVEAVINHSGWHYDTRKPSTLAAFKTYVRHPEHLNLIKKAFREHLGYDAPILYLQGDICRQELLLEVEGVLSKPR